MKQSRLFSPDRISLVAFDLNGTLVKWKEAFDASYKETVQDWVGRWSGGEDGDVVGSTLQAYYEQSKKWRTAARERKGTKTGSDTRTGRGTGKAAGAGVEPHRREWIKAALKDLPFPSNDENAAAILSRIRQIQPERAKLADGAKEALALLSERYRLVIISDTNRKTALQLWDRLGLRDYVPESQLFTPPSSGSKKPSIARFRAVTDALRVSPARCVMVGDSWNRDVAGAVRAGWRAVWVRSRSKRQTTRRLLNGKPVARIGSLTALPRLLR
ncbi:HAD family hydrolase [Paenibacillus alkalitolerans]|uniref:HAD family hydrolase n=1 Tax=Paenibacillus alkalitolerans TaxID=2799335 RepID=UPI0018F75065|nr:HAD family hydrolase [Paenibacillus alkalitolerans]